MTLPPHTKSEIVKKLGCMSKELVAKEMKLSVYCVEKVKKEIVIPIKSETEKHLFEKYKKWLSADHVPQEIIDNFNLELKINNL